MDVDNAILRSRIGAELDNVITRGKTPEAHLKALAKRIAKYNVEARIGWILHAGMVSADEFQVQFNSQSEGWSSRWPGWAFSSARDALLNDKQVWVISTGPPFGHNLLQVLVLNMQV